MVGVLEGQPDLKRSSTHLMMAASRGDDEALAFVRTYYEGGVKASRSYPWMTPPVTREQYEKTLRAYHDSVSGMRSEERVKAAADRSDGLIRIG